PGDSDSRGRARGPEAAARLTARPCGRCRWPRSPAARLPGRHAETTGSPGARSPGTLDGHRALCRCQHSLRKPRYGRSKPMTRYAILSALLLWGLPGISVAAQDREPAGVSASSPKGADQMAEDIEVMRRL